MADHPLCEVVVEKTLQDTGQPGRPFFAKVSEVLRLRLFGLLIFKSTNKGNFPDPAEKK